VRRFGPAAAQWHEWRTGSIAAAAAAGARAADRPQQLREGEATSEEAVLFALRSLVARVVDDLGAAGKRAGRLVFALECENGDVRELTTRVAQPTAVPGTLFDLLRARLEGITLDARSSACAWWPRPRGRRRAAGALCGQRFPDPDALGIVLARLDAALGEGARGAPGSSPARASNGAVAHDPFTLERW